MTNELYHHGVLGMKWGVRRYQNYDGSYTQAGMKRYAIARENRERAQGLYKQAVALYNNRQVDEAHLKEAKDILSASKRAEKNTYKQLKRDKLADEGQELYKQGKRIELLLDEQASYKRISTLLSVGSGILISAGTGLLSGTVVNSLLPAAKSALEGITGNVLQSVGGETLKNITSGSLMSAGKSALAGIDKDALSGTVNEVLGGIKAGRDTLKNISGDSLLSAGKNALAGIDKDAILGKAKEMFGGLGESIKAGLREKAGLLAANFSTGIGYGLGGAMLKDDANAINAKIRKLAVYGTYNTEEGKEELAALDMGNKKVSGMLESYAGSVPVSDINETVSFLKAGKDSFLTNILSGSVRKQQTQ